LAGKGGGSRGGGRSSSGSTGSSRSGSSSSSSSSSSSGGRSSVGRSSGGGVFGGSRSSGSSSSSSSGKSRSSRNSGGGGLFGGGRNSNSDSSSGRNRSSRSSGGGGLFGGGSSSSSSSSGSGRSSGGGLFGGGQNRNTGSNYNTRAPRSYTPPPPRPRRSLWRRAQPVPVPVPVPYHTRPAVGETKSPRGCLRMVLAVVFVICFITPLLSNGVMSNTEKREPLSGVVMETEYYIDMADFISSKSELEAGLRTFYEKTGVQPFIYILNDMENVYISNSDSEWNTMANAAYDELFVDEGHLLIMFCDYDNGYGIYYLLGSQAERVMDDAAMKVLLNHIDANYHKSPLSNEEVFSLAFAESANEIMPRKTDYFAYVFFWGIGLGLFFLFVVLPANRKKKIDQAEREEREKEELRKILEVPLETFGSDEAAERAKKYDEVQEETTKE